MHRRSLSDKRTASHLRPRSAEKHNPTREKDRKKQARQAQAHILTGCAEADVKASPSDT